MDNSDVLFAAFSDAMNSELANLGCRLRVARRAPVGRADVVLVDSDGREVGRLPDHADAAIIAAVSTLLAVSGAHSFPEMLAGDGNLSS